MNLEQIGIEEAVAGVRRELSALRVTLEAIGETRAEMYRRAGAFEAEILTRVGESERRAEETCTILEAKVAEGEYRIEQRIAAHESGEALVPQVQEVMTRLTALEGRMTRLEAETAEAQRFVKRIQNLRLLRVRRRLLQRVHG